MGPLKLALSLCCGPYPTAMSLNHNLARCQRNNNNNSNNDEKKKFIDKADLKAEAILPKCCTYKKKHGENKPDRSSLRPRGEVSPDKNTECCRRGRRFVEEPEETLIVEGDATGSLKEDDDG